MTRGFSGEIRCAWALVREKTDTCDSIGTARLLSRPGRYPETGRKGIPVLSISEGRPARRSAAAAAVTARLRTTARVRFIGLHSLGRTVRRALQPTRRLYYSAE